MSSDRRLTNLGHGRYEIDGTGWTVVRERWYSTNNWLLFDPNGTEVLYRTSRRDAVAAARAMIVEVDDEQ